MQSSWTDLRKRARVVMIIDSSSSMGARAAGSTSKLQLAKQAALGALPSFANDDEVALWSFAAAPREVVPLGPFRDQQSTIRQEIEQLEAQGSRKALYATITKAWSASAKDLIEHESMRCLSSPMVGTTIRRTATSARSSASCARNPRTTWCACSPLGMGAVLI
jgi:Mg-chelatase subunit ChlD